jgi:hypothetical protein
MNMKKNIGRKDRIIRFVIGMILLLLITFTDNRFIQWFLFLLVLTSFFEALAGRCFVYALLGKNTCPVK